MGQMGNSEEATLPDDMPFTIDDLDMEDDGVPDYQTGGYVAPTFNPGQVQQSQFTNYTPQYTAYQAPDYTNQATGYQPPQQAATPMAPSTTPTFSSFVTPTYVSYVNEAGNTIQIPVDANGNPLIPVPAGFTAQGEQPTTPTTPTPTTPTTTTSFTVPKPYDEGQGSRDDASDSGPPAGITTTNAKAAALTMINPEFAKVINSINNKYPSGGIKSPLIAVIDGFKKMSETKKAINDFDMDTAASGLGLSTEDLSNVIDTFGNEIYSGYRDAEGNITAESIAKGPKSSDGLVQQMKDGFSKVTGIGQVYDEGDYESGTSVSDVPTVPVTDIRETAITDIADAQKTKAALDALENPTVVTAQVREAEAGKSISDNIEATAKNIAENLDRVGLDFNTPTGRTATLDYLDAVINQTATEQQVPNAKESITYTPETDDTRRDDAVAAAIALKEQLLAEEAQRAADKAKREADLARRTKRAQDARTEEIRTEQRVNIGDSGESYDSSATGAALESSTRGSSTPGGTGMGRQDYTGGGGQSDENPGGGSPSGGSTTSSSDGFDDGGAFSGMAQGGLASKPKPKKTKKMKKGGLASKK